MENNFNGFFEEEPVKKTETDEDVVEAEAEDEEVTPFEVIDEVPTPEDERETDADSDAVYLYGDDVQDWSPKKKAREKKLWPLVVVTALITSLLTSALCGVLYMFTTPKSQSTIIYRDGNDMRTKIDLMTALGLDNADEGKPLSVTDVANRVSPSVVGISTKGMAMQESLFGIMQQPFTSSGTGFIVSTDGYIVTNNHVIENASEIIVTLDADNELPATLIGTDAQTDLAVLKIEKTGLTPAVLGSSGDVQVGEVAIAIGNPLGQQLSDTVTAGIISATNRKVTVDGTEYTLLQTDAAINSGNSGGPLANAYGEIIGINNAKIAASGVEGLGFAIPSDIAKPIIEDLIAVGYVRGRPLIGINGRNITEEISEYYNLPIGIYVVSVVEFSAAEKAGLQIGDVITHCNGQKIATVDELNEIRDAHAAGDTLTLTVIRGEKTMDIELILGEDRPSVSLN